MRDPFNLKSNEIQEILVLYKQRVINENRVQYLQRRLSFYQHLFLINEVIDYLFEINGVDDQTISLILQVNYNEKSDYWLNENNFFVGCGYYVIDSQMLEEYLHSKIEFLPLHEKLPYLYKQRKIIIENMDRWSYHILSKLFFCKFRLPRFKAIQEYLINDNFPSQEGNSIAMFCITTATNYFQKNFNTAFAVEVSLAHQRLMVDLNTIFHKNELFDNPSLVTSMILMNNPLQFASLLCYIVINEPKRIELIEENLEIILSELMMSPIDRIYPSNQIHSRLEVLADKSASMQSKALQRFVIESIDAFEVWDYKNVLEKKLPAAIKRKKLKENLVKLKFSNKRVAKIAVDLFIDRFDEKIYSMKDNPNTILQCINLFEQISNFKAYNLDRSKLNNLAPLNLKTKSGVDFLCCFLYALMKHNLIEQTDKNKIKNLLVFYLKPEDVDDPLNQNIGLTDTIRTRIWKDLDKLDLEENGLYLKIGFRTKKSFQRTFN